jgi:hypothetical protein
MNTNRLVRRTARGFLRERRKKLRGCQRLKKWYQDLSIKGTPEEIEIMQKRVDFFSKFFKK